MKVIFENTHTKNTKEFIFTVLQKLDGTYVIAHVSYRIMPDASRRVVTQREWTANDLQELKEGEFMNTRQGKLFANSLT
ncbi:hypothetical protein EHW64_20710 [Erwinia psidii]|uniref:hypothetical protein n=1 Tax=Erwinia psidii TaxID=69224 RepID=UPI00226BB804|nr:hypothetical protein [Erwinia psidii]MCX8959341.1 hypothetical protein [Erwinia psidii]MCX8963450.1 hypothetical protein [Erwinia psidii]